MLSGIKVGKKKKKQAAAAVAATGGGTVAESVAVAPRKESISKSNSNRESDSNAQAAALLRQQLLSGNVPSDIDNNNQALTDQDPTLMTMMRPHYNNKPLEDMTVAEMAAAERLTSGSASSRREQGDVMRHYKHSSKRRRFVDSDDEEEDQLRAVGMGEDKQSDTKKQKAQQKQAKRDTQRQEHAVQKKNQLFQAAMSKSWWWPESEKFHQPSLLSQGKHVSLVWAPPYCYSNENASHKLPLHMFLVPTAASTAFRQCEDETTWNEIYQFHQSLQNMYQPHNLSVVLAEIAGSSSSYWQAKMHVFVLPSELADDVSMFVRQTVSEYGYERHEWIDTNRSKKPLTRAVPKEGFSYLYVQYDAHGNGGVQLIDNDNSNHKRISNGFWTDMMAGVQGTMTTKGKINAKEQQVELDSFGQAWQKYDWTTSLR